MKRIFSCILFGCLTAAILLTIVSCTPNGNGEPTPTAEESTPNILEQITPNPTPSEEIIPEGTAPEEIIETTSAETTSAETTSAETTSIEAQTQTSPPIIDSQEPPLEETTTPRETATPEETTIPEETATPEQTTQPAVENTSAYDNDHNGVRDIFYFWPTLPERFENGDTLHFSAGYSVQASGMGTGSVTDGENYQYWYCREGRNSYILYQIEVDEAGIYELAIHQRMRDTEERGAKITVNNGEQVLQISYRFATNEELLLVCDNEKSMSSFMFGIVLELKEGINTVKIEAAGATEKNQYFRDFYLIKITD